MQYLPLLSRRRNGLDADFLRPSEWPFLPCTDVVTGINWEKIATETEMIEKTHEATTLTAHVTTMAVTLECQKLRETVTYWCVPVTSFAGIWWYSNQQWVYNWPRRALRSWIKTLWSPRDRIVPYGEKIVLKLFPISKISVLKVKTFPFQWS